MKKKNGKDMSMVNKRKLLRKLSWELIGTDYYIVHTENEKVEWQLYLKNEDIGEEDTLMLSSDNNSIKELKKFVKTRKDISEIRGFYGVQIIIMAIMLSILIIALFLKISDTAKMIIRTIILTIDGYAIFSNFVLNYFNGKKTKNFFARQKDKLKIIHQAIEEKISKINQKMEGEKNGTRYVSNKKEKKGKKE